jgi:long-subunit acyl-CoA synthetase (AMP-forming)
MNAQLAEQTFAETGLAGSALMYKWAKAIGTRKTLSMQISESIHSNGCKSMNCCSNSQQICGKPIGYKMARKVLLGSLQKYLGLDFCKVLLSSSATVTDDDWDYLSSIELPILELYGFEECSGVHALSSPSCWRRGYCGRTLWGTSSQQRPLGTAPPAAVTGAAASSLSSSPRGGGGLAIQGRHIFKGYIQDSTCYAAIFSDDGFYESGEHLRYFELVACNMHPCSSLYLSVLYLDFILTSNIMFY